MDYIKMLVSSELSNDDILYSFFLHPLSREQKKRYTAQELDFAATCLFEILKETPTEHILDIIESHKDEISEMTTVSIPQFSDLLDADRIPDIVLANPGCSYKLIGYFFNKDADESANQKYGENHYKLSAQLGLCEYADRSAQDGVTAVSFLGLKYKDLPLDQRNQLRPKLCLQIPFIQHILVESRHGTVDAIGELQTLLTPSTAIRRRSSLQQILRAIEGTLTTEIGIIRNIEWGYKRK